MPAINASPALPKRSWSRPLLLAVFAIYLIVYFGSVIFSDRLLAVGDGVIFYLPAVLSRNLHLWSEYTLAGSPAIGDLQQELFYLPRLLITNFNLFVIAAYFVAGVGMFGFAFRLTRSTWAALVAAAIVVSSGFMMAHLGHTSMIHSAAWTPAILWCIVSLRDRGEWLIVSIGAVAISCCFQAGHPQVSIYCLSLAAAYGVQECISLARAQGFRMGARLAGQLFAMFALGCMLASISLLPFAETASDSLHNTWSIVDFNTYSHTFESLLLLVFPNIYGGSAISGPYFGPWNLTELAIYVGILPVLLAVTGMFSPGRDCRYWFWFGVCIFALAFMLGTATPLGAVIYDIPVLGKFRAQARFGIVLLFAVSVLAAYGTAALLSRQISSRRAISIIGCCSIALLGLEFCCWLRYPSLIEQARLMNITLDGFFANPSIFVPLIISILSLGVLAFSVVKAGHFSALLILVVVTLDLNSFGWFYEWRYSAVPASGFKVSPDVAAQIQAIASKDGRILPIAADHMQLNPFRPNVNTLFNLKSVVGYGPLLSSRQAKFATETVTGGFSVTDPDRPLMDVLGVRWLAGIDRNSNSEAGPLLLGTGCGSNGSRRIRAALPPIHDGQFIRIVSNLGCSVGLIDGTSLATIQLLDVNKRVVQETSFTAGHDSAEWAYDRSDVRQAIRHRRPAIASSFAADGFEGHWYESRIDLQQVQATQIELIANIASDVLVSVASIELVDAATGSSRKLALEPFGFGRPGSLSAPLDLPNLPMVEERSHFKGLVWSVCRARSIGPAALVAALSTGASAGHAAFDPFAVALVERDVVLPTPDCQTPAETRILDQSAGYWQVETKSAGRSILVVSDSYNSGWNVSVDGKEQAIFPVDGLILGTQVEPGNHVIEFRYMPLSFVAGATLSGLGVFFCLCAALSGPLLRRWRRAGTV